MKTMSGKKYIDAELLRAKMYHDAFETDSEEQKWNGGCWIRYKMFERNIDAIPAADVVEVVRCKECSRQLICFHSDSYFCADGRRIDE